MPTDKCLIRNYHGVMQEPGRLARVESSDYTVVGGYFEVMAVALAAIGLGMAVGATAWLRPPLLYLVGPRLPDAPLRL